MIRTEWNKLSVDGVASFVLKEKLKLLKTSIKCWVNSNLFADMAKAKELRHKMDLWDKLVESRGLSTVEMAAFVATRRDYFQAEKIVSQSIKQKSRVTRVVARDKLALLI